jgi:hypothetical protein
MKDSGVQQYWVVEILKCTQNLFGKNICGVVYLIKGGMCQLCSKAHGDCLMSAYSEWVKDEKNLGRRGFGSLSENPITH